MTIKGEYEFSPVYKVDVIDGKVANQETLDLVNFLHDLGARVEKEYTQPLDGGVRCAYRATFWNVTVKANFNNLTAAERRGFASYDDFEEYFKTI